MYWARNGEKFASISFRSEAKKDKGFIILSYKYNGDPIQYKVELTTIQSNLNKGLIWYFVCPETGKRCRKLYQNNGYFLHRETNKGAMYETQTQSKLMRYLEKRFGNSLRLDRLYKEVSAKHFKTHYNGKPTKRYIKLMTKIQQAQKVDLNEFYLMMVK